MDPSTSPDAPAPSPALRIGRVDVYQLAGAVAWVGGLAIDADGAPDAYAPLLVGLRGRDYLANAGRPGHWYGLVTDEHGEPIVQGVGDPCPGYYVSTTALADHARRHADPRRYVNSAKVPYLAIPPELQDLGVSLSDVALVSHHTRSCPAIVADVGPRGSLGEGSIALAAALGLTSDPRHGGTGEGAICVVFPGSGRGWPRSVEDVTAQVEELMAAWAGRPQLAAILHSAT